MLVGRSAAAVGERQDQRGQAPQRLSSRPQHQYVPALGGGPQRGDHAGPHERRLADAGSTDDGRHRVLAQTGDHLEHVGGPAEEAIRVALLERRQPGVGTAIGRVRADGPPRQHRLESGEQLRRAVDAPFLPLLEAAVDDVGQPLGQIGELVADARVGLVREIGVSEQRLLRQRLHGVVSSEQLVEHDPDRPEIRAVVGAARLELLGGHVGHRAADAIGPAGAAGHRRAVGEQGGDAEVEHLHGAAGGDEDVLRLEVAVDDVALMRAGERADHGHRQLDGAPRWKLASAGGVAKVRTVEMLEHHVGRPLVLVGLVDYDDVLVLAARRGARLAEEIPGQSGGACEQHLDRHGPSEPNVAGEIDDSHPTAPELANDLVLSDARPTRERRRSAGRRTGWSRRGPGVHFPSSVLRFVHQTAWRRSILTLPAFAR